MKFPDSTMSHSPLFIEALAYHEAGHVVMSLVLDIPLQRAVIADACDVPNYNGLVEVEGEPMVPRLRQVLMLLASEFSEDLAPNRKKFGRLKGFAKGRRNDRVNALNIMAPVYQMMGLAPSSAFRLFREQTRPPLLAIMGHPKNQKAVREIAAILIARKSLDRQSILAFKTNVILPDGVKLKTER